MEKCQTLAVPPNAAAAINFTRKKDKSALRKPIFLAKDKPSPRSLSLPTLAPFPVPCPGVPNLVIHAPLDITVRIGCHIVYEAITPTPVLLILKPRISTGQVICEEKLTFGPGLSPEEFEDVHGNIVHRATLRQGLNEFHHDALVAVSSLPDTLNRNGEPLAVDELPAELLRYTLPSRYCDSDKLLDFAWMNFGHIPHGFVRVQAISDWVHHHIEYRHGSGRSDISASEVIACRYGVCRDFAHVMIALCRAFNIPARYVTGHLPDIGCPDSSMDFHAYMEVHIGGKWHTCDARFNCPRIGRVKIAHGLDAVDAAITTLYGAASLHSFEVWAYQVNPKEVSIADPIDLSKRLDGVMEVQHV